MDIIFFNNCTELLQHVLFNPFLRVNYRENVLEYVTSVAEHLILLFQDGLLSPLVLVFFLVQAVSAAPVLWHQLPSQPRRAGCRHEAVSPRAGCYCQRRARQAVHTCGSGRAFLFIAKQECTLAALTSSSQECDKDQMEKWHCQNTQPRDEEESISGDSKARNTPADMR